MATIEQVSLWLHIATGTVAVVAGLGALLATKGGKLHRRAGKLFVGSMAVVVGTVFVLAAVDGTPFRVILTLVAAFSGYLVFSGYRAVPRTGPLGEGQAVDWAAAGSVVVACLGLGAWGLLWLAEGTRFGIVMVVFGGIGVAFGSVDIRRLREEWSGPWMVNHLQRMTGAVIATVSAVSAVNLTAVLGIAAWLWPTAVGVPLIYYWSAKYS